MTQSHAQFHRHARLAGALVLGLGIAGCSVGPDVFGFPVSDGARQSDWPGLMPLGTFDATVVPRTEDEIAAEDAAAALLAARVKELRREARQTSGPVLTEAERERLSQIPGAP